MTDKRKKLLGAPPADWLSQSDVVMRGSQETQRLPRGIGRPPREFGDTSSERLRAIGPLTALVVSEDRIAAARLAISLASAQVSIRLALALDDVEVLLEGATAVFVVVPRSDHPVARALRNWGDAGRAVFALVSDRDTANRVRGHCDAALEPPWDVTKALASLSR